MHNHRPCLLLIFYSYYRRQDGWSWPVVFGRVCLSANESPQNRPNTTYILDVTDDYYIERGPSVVDACLER